MGIIADQLRSIAASRRVDVEKTPSCVALLKAFLGREVLWAERLSLTDELPFVDLAGGVDSSIRCPEEEMEFTRAFSQSLAESRSCRHMLHWDRLLSYAPQTLRAFSLPDPYEPLIRFFMRGGCFSREHRIFIEVNRTVTLNYGSLRGESVSEPIIALDDHLLDRLDIGVK